MTFTKELWAAMEPIYGAILAHPFVRGLTDGSLSHESFRFYVVQDALYLREFARALSVAAARAPVDGDADPRVGLSAAARDPHRVRARRPRRPRGGTSRMKPRVSRTGHLRFKLASERSLQ